MKVANVQLLKDAASAAGLAEQRALQMGFSISKYSIPGNQVKSSNKLLHQLLVQLRQTNVPPPNDKCFQQGRDLLRKQRDLMVVRSKMTPSRFSQAEFGLPESKRIGVRLRSNRLQIPLLK